LYREVRKGAIYERSLELLRRAKSLSPEMPTKTGLMLGLGEAREEVLAAYVDDPSRWSCAVRIELPVASSEGLLLDYDQAQWFLTAHRDLMKRLGVARRDDVLAELARWRSGVAATPVALRLIDNIQQFLRPELIDSHLLRLGAFEFLTVDPLVD